MPPPPVNGFAAPLRLRRMGGSVVYADPRAPRADSFEEDSMHETTITLAGLAGLCEELTRLKTTGRQEIADRLRDAASMEADVNANAGYIAAREEQAHLEARISQLEQRLATTRVVEPDGANDIVDLGERVRLRDLDTGSRGEYPPVGPYEAAPGAGRISAEAPRRPPPVR